MVKIYIESLSVHNQKYPRFQETADAAAFNQLVSGIDCNQRKEENDGSTYARSIILIDILTFHN